MGFPFPFPTMFHFCEYSGTCMSYEHYPCLDMRGINPGAKAPDAWMKKRVSVLLVRVSECECMCV